MIRDNTSRPNLSVPNPVSYTHLNLQQITQRLNKLQPGTTPEVQNAVREYQDSVKEFVAEARNYIIINSSYGEAYTQLFTKYNKMIGKANAVNMADLDVTEKK